MDSRVVKEMITHQGLTPIQTAVKLNIPFHTVRRYRKMFDIPTQKQQQNKERREKIFSLREQGLTCTEIGKRVNMQRQNVYRILEMWRPDLLGSKCSVREKERNEKMCALRAEGKTYKEIGELVGYDAGGVWRIVNRKEEPNGTRGR